MRALESCLRVERKGVRVEVLVIDGNSTDGSFAELQERYSADPRVRAVRQEGPEGFMPACFFALPQVRTPFVTFMYDDDVHESHERRSHRSEEHTSELQSQSNLVCRLLLEKKKSKRKQA